MRKPIRAALVGAAVVAALSLTGCAPTSPATTCKVSDKDHSVTRDGPVYRIYSSCGVFNVEDASLVGQFNAADTYGAIEVGKTYRFTTYGYRNGFFSMFPNITKAEEVSQ